MLCKVGEGACIIYVGGRIRVISCVYGFMCFGGDG
jgi:hypothetical protein